VSEWSWECDPNAEEVLGGLPADLVLEVESIARRLCDAASALHLGEPAMTDSGLSGVENVADGPWLVWYLKHRRRRKIYVVKVVNRSI
jgi:hypothetical protein